MSDAAPAQPTDKKPAPAADEPASQTLNRFMLKLKYSFYSALVFFLFANPETYRVVQRVVGRKATIISEAGAPTSTGFFIQTGLFFTTMLGLMMLPSY